MRRFREIQFVVKEMPPAPKTLFDFPFSGNGYKIRLALTQLNLPFEYQVINLLAGEGQSPEFLALAPVGQVPALRLVDGTLFWESNAIVYWLTEGTSLMPSDKLSRTRVVQWMNFEQSNIEKVLGRTRFLRRYPEFTETRQSDWDGWFAAGYRALNVIEAELAIRPYMVGHAYSAADICLFGYMHSAEEGGFDLTRYAAVSAQIDRVREQPLFQSLPMVDCPLSAISGPAGGLDRSVDRSQPSCSRGVERPRVIAHDRQPVCEIGGVIFQMIRRQTAPSLGIA